MWTINRGLRAAAGFTNWCGMMKILRRFGLKDGELEGGLRESHQK